MMIGYGCIPRDGKSEHAVNKALVALGAEKTFIDSALTPGQIRDGAKREWRDGPIFVGHALRSGDELILLSAESLVDRPETDIDGTLKSYRRMKAEFRRILKPLAVLGVRVRIGDGDPVLYDTDDAVDAFIDMAVDEAHRRASGKGGKGEKRKPGRPIKYYATDEQKKAICLMWWDKAIERDTVRHNATEMLGWTVTDNVIKTWCGVKREKPDE